MQLKRCNQKVGSRRVAFLIGQKGRCRTGVRTTPHCVPGPSVPNGLRGRKHPRLPPNPMQADESTTRIRSRTEVQLLAALAAAAITLPGPSQGRPTVQTWRPR